MLVWLLTLQATYTPAYAYTRGGYQRQIDSSESLQLQMDSEYLPLYDGPLIITKSFEVIGGSTIRKMKSSSRALASLTTLNENTFANNTILDCAGGNSALIIRSGGVTVKNVTFLNCLGSAVVVTNAVLSAGIQFINCQWIGNLGSAVSVTNVTYQSPGPAPSVSFSSCSFQRNSATAGQSTAGGAARISFTGSPGSSYPYCPVGFSSCSFTNNKAFIGGAVYAAGDDASNDPPYYNVSFSGSLFNGNLADNGPAIYLGNNVMLSLMDGCTIQNNTNTNTTGSSACGALCVDFASNAKMLTIQNSIFSKNGGGLCSNGGAVNYQVASSSSPPFTLSNVTLDSNTCIKGGGLYVDTSPQVYIRGSLFQNNQASDSGGGVFFQACSSFQVLSSTFRNNSAAVIGGGLSQADIGSFNITSTIFNNNVATFGGALSGGRDSDLIVGSSSFTTNLAGSYAGAVLCVECSTVQVTGSSFDSNSAGTAGALGLAYVSSSIAISSSVFQNNFAASNQQVRFYHANLRSSPGAGGALAIVVSSPTTISGSTFHNNTATFGAGLYMSQECSAIVTALCPTQASISVDSSTIFTGNTVVGGNGGAVFAASPSSLSITCSGSSATFSGSSSVSKLLSNDTTVLNASGCPSWTGNSAIGGSLGGATLSTPAYFVRLTSLSTDLTSYASNGPVVAQFQLLDLWQQRIGPQGIDANSMTLFAGTTGNQSLSGSVASAVNGTVTFSQLKVLASPGNTTLSFSITLPTGSASQPLIAPPSTPLTIRPCLYGEVRSLDNTLCTVCPPGSFSANPSNTVCDICPDNAACVGGSTVIPNAGYWHSHPFSPEIHPCQNSACDFANRTNNLIQLSLTFNPALPNVSVQLAAISNASCQDGYDGNLCGDCQPGYGHDSNGVCSQCILSSGTNAFLFVLSFSLTLLIVVITIRTVFTEGVHSDELKQIRDEQKAALIVEIQKIKATSGGSSSPAEAVVPEKQGLGRWINGINPSNKPTLDAFTKMSAAELRPPTRSDRPPTRSNDPSYTGWKMSKGKPPYSIVLKIIISYLQVITVIKNVGLDLPSFFDGFLGSNRQASSASGSLVVLECSLQDESHGGGLSKSLQMALIMISVPFVFLAFAPLVWLAFYKLQQYYNKKVTLAKVSSVKSEDTIEGIPSGKVEPFLSDHQDRFSSTPLIWGKEDSDVKIRFYLRKRMIITFIVVLFVMYPDTTDAFMSLFSCTCLDSAANPYAIYRLATGCYYSYDMTTKCYSGQHLLVMVLVGVPGALFWALGVPVGFAIYLWHYRSRLDEKMFAGGHSFMYEDYKPQFYQWECVILMRKFCTVIAVVFLRSISSSFLMLILLAVAILFLTLQLIYQPYQVDRMNKLEDMSLMSTVFTFYIVSLFAQTDVVTYNARYGLSILLVIENVIFIAYCIWMLSLEVYEIALESLDVDSDGQVTEFEIKAYIRISVGSIMAPVVTPLVTVIFRNRKRLFLRKREAANQALSPDTPGSQRALLFASNQVHPDSVRPFEASLRGDGDRKSTRQVELELDGVKEGDFDEIEAEEEEVPRQNLALLSIRSVDEEVLLVDDDKEQQNLVLRINEEGEQRD